MTIMIVKPSFGLTILCVSQQEYRLLLDTAEEFLPAENQPQSRWSHIRQPLTNKVIFIVGSVWMGNSTIGGWGIVMQHGPRICLTNKHKS